MKLGICCNFTFPSTGGSEAVCKAIAEHMVQEYGIEVISFGHNVKKEIIHNRVVYKPCQRGDKFIDQIKDFDHIFIYSDSFWGFKDIVKNLDKINATLSIALLGMYNMIADKELFEIFKKNRHRFRVITHSNDYQDYIKCFKEGIPVDVIPNGVDLEEFNHTLPVNFKQKYEIDTKHILLNVSNYFYGKGQEFLADIGSELALLRNDFTIVSISNTVAYPHDKTFLNKTKKILEVKSQPRTINITKKSHGFKYKFLRDIPREDVVSAFYYSDAFVFPSLKEVFPLVILESMAAELHWFAMDVGNVANLRGGTVVKNMLHDQKGYKVFREDIAKRFAEVIHRQLNLHHMEDNTEEGLDMVELMYDWKNICERYYNIFIG